MRERLSWLLVSAMVIGALASPAAQAQEGTAAPASPAVVAPGGDPLGVPYDEWAARWFQWFVGVPATEHPGIVDNCAAGDMGDALFIAHVGPGSTMETTCTATTDQHILASGGGTLCDAPDYGTTPEERLACVQADKAVFSNVSVTVDGVPVPDIETFWVESPDFDLTYPDGNLYEIPAGTTQGRVGAFLVMIEPLPPGTHTVVVHDEIDIPDDDEGPLAAELVATIEVVEAGATADTLTAPTTEASAAP